MTDKMLERMARAMWNAARRDDDDWTDYLPLGRAALEAIREPSEVVSAAGEAVLDLHEEEPLRFRIENAGEGFTAVIDAILSEEEELGSLAPLVPTEQTKGPEVVL